ncbi:MAG: tetratricopeptide repeat protein [Hyphomicrobiaceae bacterium]
MLILIGASTVIVAGAGISVSPARARSPEAVKDEGTLFGSYLAGRIARGKHDTASASEFYRRALDRDPGNEALIEQALLMNAAEGRMEDAIRLARKLLETRPTHRMAKLAVALEDVKAGRYAEADEHFKTAGIGLIGEVTGTLARAWLKLAQGDVEAAGTVLDGLRNAEWTQVFLRYHKALIFDSAGRHSEAREIYDKLFHGETRSLRVTLAYAHHASATGDQKLARSILDEYIRKSPSNAHPVAKALARQLARSDEQTPLLIEKPIEGVAEVMYGLGEALAQEATMASVGAIYLQMALYLQPDHSFALAALANYYETIKKHEEAIAAYDRIPADSPLHSAVEIRKALNLNQVDRVEEAKALLEKLAHSDPKDIKPLDALGSIMRARKRYKEAADYYTKAISLLGPRPDKRNWTYFYARGTSYERLKRWSLAEPDLQKALRMAPDQPHVLNYLGYSWVDQNKNLRQGLSLIEKAVNLKPDDGYIVDSLGWAHYRLGNYKEAVRYLERAVELRPEDPVLNDHLGDAYWRAGRRNEARFQWYQALTLNPEPEDAERIKAKMEHGLASRHRPRTARKSREASRQDAQRRRSQ